jgi:hypothetical protein
MALNSLPQNLPEKPHANCVVRLHGVSEGAGGKVFNQSECL